MNIFEYAARNKLRFPSVRGELTVEQLFGLPLTSNTGKANLDDIARAINSELKSMEEESFVETRSNPRRPQLAAALEIVKFVIADTQAENAARRDAADKAERRQKLAEALSRKRDNALENMSEEEILAELDKLAA